MIGLFGEVETLGPAAKKEARASERRRKAKLAYDATSEQWKRWTYKVAVGEFLLIRATFIFEELSMYYESEAKTRGLPLTVNGKAFAGLQRRLIAEGKIELIPNVMRTRSNGQDGKVYRSLLHHDVDFE